MSNPRIRFFLPALLSAAALFTFACNRGEEERAGQISTETETAAQAEAQPQPNELRPEPRSVEIPAETPPNVNEQRAELSAHERKLAAREAELDAREQRLRERERRARSTPRAPAPAPVAEPEREPERSAEVIPAPEPEPEPASEEPSPEIQEDLQEDIPEPRTTTVTVPSGTVLDVEFTETLSSATSAPGEAFRARVTRDVMEDGEVVIPAGSEILGEVTEAVPTRRVGGKAKLELRFTDLVLPSGATVPIDASFVQQGRSETGRDAATIGGGAAAGAVLGRVLGKGNRSKGSVIGAIIGAAAGAVIASRTPGEEVVIPDGTVVSLRLDEAVEVRVSR
jgi:type IV secretory pathway VirB10-like protein